jgi:peptidoglycan/LPS O-acetylase OafA/YrhL
MQFPVIDVLRAYAALSVVLLHVVALFEWTTFPQSGPFSWFHIGGMGVDLFFVISGFVISLSAFKIIDSQESGFRFDFFVRRFARIAPLYYATCIFFVLFIYPHYLFDGSLLADALAHLFFVHNLSERYQGAINGVNWSVGVEMQFYLFILVFVPILRIARPWLIAAILVGVSWIWRYQVMQHADITGPAGVYPRFWAMTQLPGMLDEFAAGILLARFIRSDVGSRILAFCTRRTWIIAIVTIALTWPAVVFMRQFLINSWISTEMAIFGRTVLALTWAFLVFVACCLRGPVTLFLTAPARYLGTISYGIYLWHLPVIMTLHLRLTWLDGQRALPYVLILTCGLASGSWHFFERPFIERAKIRLNLRKEAAAISSAVKVRPVLTARSS